MYPQMPHPYKFGINLDTCIVIIIANPYLKHQPALIAIPLQASKTYGSESSFKAYN